MFLNNKYTSFFNNILFWIVVFFVVRLIGITNPPLEVAHNWRQTTVTMVARNFVEIDSNIFYPRVDIGEEKTGITGMEFPVLNYLIYIISLIFGYDHWYGRLINLVVSSVGVYYFYLLVRRFFDHQLAFVSSLILLSTLWFPYSRKIMPDTFAMSFVLGSIYYASQFLAKKGWSNLFLYWLLGTVGVLAKLPVAYLFILIIPLFLQTKELFSYDNVKVAIAGLLILAPSLWWYFKWVPFLVEEFGFWHFYMGESFGSSIAYISSHLGKFQHRFTENALRYIGFVFFITGLFFAFKKRDVKVLSILLFGTVGFAVIILKAGFAFVHHDYYIIPFVPVMALGCGFGIVQLKHYYLQYIVVFLIFAEFLSGSYHDFFIKDYTLYQLEAALDQVTERKELIAINSGKVPTAMYFAHRKGWISYNEELQDAAYRKEIKEKGCKYVVIIKEIEPDYSNFQSLKKVYDDEDFLIYQL